MLKLICSLFVYLIVWEPSKVIEDKICANTNYMRDPSNAIK